MGQRTLLLSAVVLSFMFSSTVLADSVQRWSDETRDYFASIPIQDGGRVKPLDTYARFTLLRMNGKRTYTTETGERLSALEWLLNVLLFPEEATEYRNFCVDNSEVLTALGVDTERLRDRYAYKEIAPGREKLFELAMKYSMIEDKDRDAVQRMTINLATNVRDFEMLSSAFDFAREEVLLSPDHPLRSRFADGVLTAARCLAQGKPLQQISQEYTDISPAMNRMQFALSTSARLTLIPPSDKSVTGWYAPSSLATMMIPAAQSAPNEYQILVAIEDVVRARNDVAKFREAARNLNSLACTSASARDEYTKVPVEVSYYRLNPLFWAQWLFVVSFLLLAISWLLPGQRWVHRCVTASVLIPWGLLVTGIVFRCIIRGRPPVSTLYESILFVTAVVVVAALLLERISRQRVAVAVASLAGTVGLFLAYRHEATGGTDTMPSLVAVLDTNFWLSTHVTTVTTGYAAGLLAGFLGCVQILSRLVGFRTADKGYYRSLTRMIYGTVCFGLVFSFVGTVLGGIWANYSWGRFWGWDPKENGALLIVLCNLGILHARLGGMIRELGMAMAAVFGGMVVAFSWWGVNLLGVGLHSYGFTSGVWSLLMWFWFSQCVVLVAAASVYARERLAMIRSRQIAKEALSPIAETVGK